MPCGAHLLMMRPQAKQYFWLSPWTMYIGGGVAELFFGREPAVTVRDDRSVACYEDV